MNFFNGCKLMVEGNKYVVEILGKKITLSDKQQSALNARNQAPCNIVVGVRPPHMQLDEGGFSGKIEVSEMMGSELHLHMNVSGTDVVAIIPTMGIDVREYSIGTTVNFSFDPDLMHLFDTESTNNLI